MTIFLLVQELWLFGMLKCISKICAQYITYTFITSIFEEQQFGSVSRNRLLKAAYRPLYHTCYRLIVDHCLLSSVDPEYEDLWYCGVRHNTSKMLQFYLSSSSSCTTEKYLFMKQQRLEIWYMVCTIVLFSSTTIVQHVHLGLSLINLYKIFLILM